jgi:hypothetical protein
MAPIILLRLPAAARVIRARNGRQVIGAFFVLQVARISGKQVVRISGTRNVKGQTKEHQFLNAGWGVHSETIVGFLREKQIKFRMSDY